MKGAVRAVSLENSEEPEMRILTISAEVDVRRARGRAVKCVNALSVDSVSSLPSCRLVERMPPSGKLPSFDSATSFLFFVCTNLTVNPIEATSHLSKLQEKLNVKMLFAPKSVGEWIRTKIASLERTQHLFLW